MCHKYHKQYSGCISSQKWGPERSDAPDGWIAPVSWMDGWLLNNGATSVWYSVVRGWMEVVPADGWMSSNLVASLFVPSGPHPWRGFGKRPLRLSSLKRLDCWFRLRILGNYHSGHLCLAENHHETDTNRHWRLTDEISEVSDLPCLYVFQLILWDQLGLKVVHVCSSSSSSGSWTNALLIVGLGSIIIFCNSGESVFIA